MIQIDTREDPKMFRLFDKESIEHEECLLVTGDYACPDKGNMIVERKTIEDFIQSYHSGHLSKQCMKMEENYAENYLFVSGYMKDLFFKKNLPNSIANCSAETYSKMKIHLLKSFPSLRIVEFPSDPQLVLGVRELFSYEGSKRIDQFVQHAVSKEDVLLSQIAVIPGIGVKKAKAIREHYTPKQLYDIDEKQLTEIKGIGGKYAKKIKEVFC